jgi:hypothetical protein
MLDICIKKGRTSIKMRPCISACELAGIYFKNRYLRIEFELARSVPLLPLLGLATWIRVVGPFCIERSAKRSYRSVAGSDVVWHVTIDSLGQE